MTRKSETQLYWTKEHVKETLPQRLPHSHKGTYGTGLLLAGSRDMPGAALLAGLGAIRSGIGKLEIGTDEEVIPVVVPSLVEATYIRNGLKAVSDGAVTLQNYRAAAAGCGIVPTEELESAICQLLESELPLVLDAGALTEREFPSRKQPVILTPHIGEFTRLTGIPKEEVQSNKAGLANQWAQKLGVTIVLKGSETVIAFPDNELWINPTGNSALAKGGTGDTLTGMLLGMLCCHDDWKAAVLNAVYLHGACADEWIKTRSAHTLLAHELTELLPEVWKRFELSA